MVNKLPTTTNTDARIKALHHAMPSALEGTIQVDAEPELELELAADVLFILWLLTGNENVYTLKLEEDV